MRVHVFPFLGDFLLYEACSAVVSFLTLYILQQVITSGAPLLKQKFNKQCKRLQKHLIPVHVMFSVLSFAS